MRSLSLVVCRPEFFVCRRIPSSSSSNGSTIQVQLAHVAEIVKLPDFGTQSRASSPKEHDGKIPTRGRFGVIQEVSSELPDDVEIGEAYSESTIRGHLRFLSPETLGLKNGSQIADIFSFGVFAFEV